MINQKTLLSLGFKLTSEHRRYNDYEKDGMLISAYKYPVQGEKISILTLNGEQHIVKTIEELNKKING